MTKSLSLMMLMLLSMPLIAQTIPAPNKPFPIEVEVQGEGLGIRAASGQVSNIATVTLTHTGTQAVLCEASFVNGPERPAAKRARLQPGEETVITQTFHREVIRVRVFVVCTVQS